MKRKTLSMGLKIGLSFTGGLSVTVRGQRNVNSHWFKTSYLTLIFIIHVDDRQESFQTSHLRETNPFLGPSYQ